MKQNKKTEEEKKIEQEADQYQKNGFFSKIPYPVKAILIKFWFFGAVCFFAFMGSGLNVASNFDLVLVAGLISGALFDIACYNVLEIIDKTGECKYYFFFKKEKCWYSIFINVAYNIVLFLAFTYSVYLFKEATNSQEHWFLREPLTQGLFLTLFDAFFLLIKNSIVLLVKNLTKKKEK